MTQDLVIGLMTEVFYTTFLILLPILGVSLVVGILISIFQAATSIQEMTLTFVPKILATAIALIILMPWMLDKLLNLIRRMVDLFPTVIR